MLSVVIGLWCGVLFDRNAVNCFFFSALSGEALEILTALPVGVDQDSFF